MWYKFGAVFLFSFLIFITVNAQLCQGSLGDPIINITFGSGTNPGAPLSAATTSYQYVPNDCPNDGFYTVRNNTSNCFSNSWYSVTSDHTGDAGGYFMLVNASIQPSAFYLDTVKGLCSNTTYELAAWIMNVIVQTACNGNSIQPNLTFSVEKTDGTVLKTYNTGNIATLSSAVWNQYGTFFTTPVGVSDVVLRIFNNSQGGCGNDLALDDITFRPCGPLLTNSIDGVPAAPVSLCEGPAKHFQLSCTVSGGFTNPVFQWQTRTPATNNVWVDIGLPVTTPALNFSIPANVVTGNYEARLAVAEAGNLGTPQCRIYSKAFIFIINANPITTAFNDGLGCENSNVQLRATGGTQYSWTGPNAFTDSGASVQLQNIKFNQAGKYYVVVSNSAGCMSMDSTIVAVNPTPVATTTFSQASICIGDSIQLTGGGGPDYLWMPVTGLSNATIFNPKASPASTITYNLIVTNQFKCTDTALVTVNVVPATIVNAGPDRTTLQGQAIQLLGSVTGQQISYSWSPAAYINDANALQPFVNPPADTTYVLTAVSNMGCKTVTDTVFVKIFKSLFIPNAFTPNGDGLNETWNIPALDSYPGFLLLVFNRFGEIVFQTSRTPVAWDGTYKGKPCVSGAYSYVIKTGKKDEIISGTLVIIR
jgi:gliding motility-associated-like protein